MADHHRRGGGRHLRQRHGIGNQDLAEQARAGGGWHRWKELMENRVGVVIKDGSLWEWIGKLVLKDEKAGAEMFRRFFIENALQ